MFLCSVYQGSPPSPSGLALPRALETWPGCFSRPAPPSWIFGTPALTAELGCQLMWALITAL